MDAYNFIKKTPTRVMIIWLSCFDQARTIKEIAKIWGYSSGKVLQLGNIPSKMLEHKLLKVERIDKKQICFRSSFENYMNLIRKLADEITIESSKNFYLSLLKDSDFFSKILDAEEYRQIFLDVYSIKKIYNSNRNLAGDYKNSLCMPVFGLMMLTLMKLIEKMFLKINFEETKNQFLKKFGVAWGIINPIINIGEYFNAVIKKLDEETYKKLSNNIEKTEFYKRYKNQLIQFLIHF